MFIKLTPMLHEACLGWSKTFAIEKQNREWMLGLADKIPLGVPAYCIGVPGFEFCLDI